MLSVWFKKGIRSPYTLFVLLCVVFYCAETTTAFAVLPSTNTRQAGLSEVSFHYRCTNTVSRMSDLDGEQREALEEVDLNQVDLTPPKPGAANKQSVDWTVVLLALYPVWVICDSVFHITSDKPYIQQLGDSIRSLL